MSHTLKQEKGLGKAVFFLSLVMALFLFIPFLIYDKGIFIYYGDYNAQQIPFYQLAHRAVRAGEIGWNWGTDLGANFVGSYSFYLLGSPFFWVTLPFPTEWVPYLMAPLLALKMAFAALAAYGYTRRFLSPRLALIAGILYAFSGFSIYNIFFNHFHEALIWFPLLLLGMEQYMQDGKKGLFALVALMSALNNYYFFIGQAVFLMIYWVIRAMSGDWERCGKRFFGLWLEALLGTAGAAILLLPSFYAVIQNGRTEELLAGWDMLIYSSEQRPLDILHSFFFPPDHPARANFLPDANNNWSSMSAWVPVFGCTGAIAYFQSRKYTDWLRRLLLVLVLCAFIPALNAAFQLFNAMYYARWFYMLTLMLILATLRCFEEDTQVNWGRAIGWSGGITAAYALCIGLLPESWTPDEETGKITIGLHKDPVRFWVFVGVAVICLIITALLVRQYRYSRERFFAAATAACVIVSMLGGWSYLTFGKATGNYPSHYVVDKLINVDEYILPDSHQFSRVDMHKGMDNQAMYWNLSSINAFHSIVPGSVMEFYPTVGVNRSVASRPQSEYYGLRGVLSVRWLFDYAQDPDDIQLYNKDAEDYFEVEGHTAMPGWKTYDKQNGFLIYENENYIPMGFTYEGYITRSEYEAIDLTDRHLALLKAIVVEDGDEDKIATTLPHLDTANMEFTEEQYAADCAKRAEITATIFTPDATGFTANITLPSDNLVFFSVPYESGWSATVNGEKTEILQTNVGFMAVKCDVGDNVTIRFDYTTPGLTAGAYISAGALLLLAVYWLVCFLRKDKTTEPPAEVPLLPPSRKPEPGGFDLYAIYRPNKE